MANFSPLRYPGGKSSLYPIIDDIIKNSKLNNCTYIEPFAGGAGIALNLLFDGIVERIVLNDADKAIYSFWRSIIESPEWFIEEIKKTPITISEWKKQREILLNSDSKYSKELGFAAFFMNRTNRSGILDAGPIGGYTQTGIYKIDCRFNKNALIEKIQKISCYRNRIKIYNQDASTYIKTYLPYAVRKGNVFIYFDPPYYEKGQRLYLNAFKYADHARLKDEVSQLDVKWVMTYDDKEAIKELYSDFSQHHFSINYSLSSKTKGNEVMIFKDDTCFPSEEIFKELPKSISF